MFDTTHKNIKNTSYTVFIFKSFITINKAEVMNQIIVKKIDKFRNFLTLKGCIHFNRENLRNINIIKNIKLIY